MDPKFAKAGNSQDDLRQAAKDRLRDAEALFAGGRYAGAIANALYSVEISLKVQICSQLDLAALPRAFEFHDIGGLMIYAGLSRRIEDSSNKRIKAAWDELIEVGKQVNDLRYLPARNWKRRTAEKAIRRVKEALAWLAKS